MSARNDTTSLDISYIQEKLDEAFCFTESSEGHDLILIVGCTGVGKSTTCNYLVGHPMRQSFHNGVPVVETATETDIRIGHGIGAETLYAKGYMAADRCFSGRQVCLVDCPGFLGNKSIEDCVVESISTELTIRSGRQVKGVLVLLSYLSLIESRMHEILKLIQILIALFKDPIEMVNHTVFVITKNIHASAEDGLKITLARMEELKAYAEKQVEALQERRNLHATEGLSIGDYDKIAGYFSAVLRNAASVVMVDPLDNGESRKRIFEQINHIKPRMGYYQKAKKYIGFASAETGFRPITIDDLNFSEYNEHRVTFNKAIYFRVREGTSLIEKIKSSSERILSNTSEITNCQIRIALLQELLSNLKEEITKPRDGCVQTQKRKNDYKSVNTFKNMLKDTQRQREVLVSGIEEIKQKRRELEEELGMIDVDDLKLFLCDQIDVKFPWYKFIDWVRKEFEFNTRDESIPIKVEKWMKNGEWKNEKDLSKTGFFSIEYESDFGFLLTLKEESAFARVEAYIKSKDDPGVRVRIQQIREELSKQDDDESKLMSKLEELDENAEALQSSINQNDDDEEGYRRSLEQKLEDCKKDISRYDHEICEQQSEKEDTRHQILKLLQEFADNRPKLDMIVTIGRLLEFPSSLVRKFISDYNTFISRLNYYAAISDEAVDESTLQHPEEDASDFDLKDPLTGNAIKDLVVTPQGTAFDAISLLKQFDLTLEDPPPFMYQREDGTVEEIECLSWNKVTDIQKYLDKQHADRLARSQSSSSQAPSFMPDVIDEEGMTRLQEQRDQLRQEIVKMKEEIEAKETDMERIVQILEKNTLT